MRDLTTIQFFQGTREEFLEDMQKDFPYASLRTEITKYQGRFIPWHWHKQAVELFWVEHGTVECRTPYQHFVLPEGSAGFVNSNVMHTRRILTSSTEPVVQYLHIFDPALIAAPGSRIERKYVLPILTRVNLDVLTLDPKSESDTKLIELIRSATFLKEDAFGYEVALREKLTHVWMLLFEKVFSAKAPQTEVKQRRHRHDEKLKLMITYIYEHFAEPITIDDLANTACVSERACFRLFKDVLNVSPMEYVKDYRVQKAAEMLQTHADTDISQIAYACGFQSGSYFGQVFKAATGQSPSEYRTKLAGF